MWGGITITAGLHPTNSIITKAPRHQEIRFDDVVLQKIFKRLFFILIHSPLTLRVFVTSW
jgi:hypothetical protein